MNYYAHTADGPDGQPDPDESRWQLLRDHLRNVAALARRFGEFLGLADAAELAGWLHDLGKYRIEFQEYLRGHRSSSKETTHAIYGAAWAEACQCILQAFAVQGHHSGLKNMDALTSACADKKLKPLEVAQKLLVIAAAEGVVFNNSSPLPDFLELVADDETVAEATCLGLELATRLVFSMLVDADRLDTAFWPQTPPAERLLDAEAGLLACQRARQKKAEASSASDMLAALRNRIFERCAAAGEKSQGFFSLTVPTGGGKTLSSLAFAMAHAQRHGLRRIIIVIPYLSIIEQNATDYRAILGEDSVLECHSAVEPREDASEEEKEKLELLTENWDAPVIVTTSLQFIESLMAAKPSRCRKLHRIARSVVIFDEVQTMPSHLLVPVLNILREFQRSYGTSFVFCSATQPAFRKAPKLPDGFTEGEVTEITDAEDGSPIVAESYRALRRVDYDLSGTAGPVAWSDLADRLAKESQVLCVVNLTRHARELWEELRKRSDAADAIHLSSYLCPQHRLDIIHQAKADLKAGRPVRIVSTQLIEAGVDVDFPVVWRALGPLDAIVQAAGRCNREGKLTDAAGNPIRGAVRIFLPPDEKIPPGVYKAATGCATLQIKQMESKAPERLAEDASIFAPYFSKLWEDIPTDYAKQGERTIQQCRANLDFADTAARSSVIEDQGQTGVIVIGCNDGSFFRSNETVEEIRLPGRVSASGTRFDRRDLQRLQRFMVNVRPKDFAKIQPYCRPLLPNLDLPVLDPACYHPQLGLLVDGQPPSETIC